MKWLSVLVAGNLALLAACGGSGNKAATPASTTTSTAAAPTTTTTASRTAAAASSATTGPARTVATTKDPVVVGLGNSVPSGAVCKCESFVSAYADMVAAGTNTKATVDNDAVSGSTSADVVNLLTKAAVQSHLRSATTVLIMTGANDFNDSFDQVSLGSPANLAYPPVATAVQDNVTAVIQQIHSLNPAAHVVILDYWAAMEDGAVAAKDYDPPTMAASVACTDAVNQALAVAAKATNALYVSTYTAFKGADGKADPTSLLAADGDHPDAAGHELIARTVYGVLPTG
ncbi:MAG TPA: SGNH/GDSL hydrolase family protein [Acidimicrobiia bacterium]|jgi:lysophospholipase L1-like esterase